MARKENFRSPGARGINDLIGIALIGVSLLLLVSMFTFDRYDLDTNRVPANEHTHNWIGPVGAILANILFWIMGASAFALPILVLGFGLGLLFPVMSYFPHRWLWVIGLLLSASGGFDLYSASLDRMLGGIVKHNLNSPSSGGIIGLILNQYLFGYFGKVGATIVFTTGYLMSLLGLTNVQVAEWIHAWRERKRIQSLTEEEGPMDEKALERRARELAKQAKKLQKEMERAGLESEGKSEAAPATSAAQPHLPGDRVELGADLKPVPEPRVRDLSVPQASPSQTPAGKSIFSAPRPMPEPAPPAESQLEGAEGDVIHAQEIPVASAEEILGKAPKTKPPTGKDGAANLEPSDGDAMPALPNPARSKLVPKKPKPLAVASTPVIGNYQVPNLDLLHLPDLTIKPTESKEELMANARLMQNTLSQFDIEVALGDITKGPTITRYELHPAPGVRLEKIAALGNNLAAALKAENVSILAPIPGKSSVGVEVPNAIKTKVIMRDLLESPEWQATKAKIPLALGKDVYGQPMIADLAEMPHLLIAGSTGSGKSVCINSIIASLLYRFPPDQMRFVMIDPKVVELQLYNSLPHLVVPVVTDPKKVILALRWVVNEMEKRYQIFARVGVRNIKSFNERQRKVPPPSNQTELPLTAKKERIEPASDGFAVELDEEMVVAQDEDIVIPDKLSYIVVVIDELADLMLVAPADVEMAIARITQMARAAGIHCIVATQRPSVDVITGVIKANIPARIAFQVAARVDSRTILDAMGADKLLGKGDMLYLPPGSSKLIRAQGALITDQEIQQIVEHITRQGKPSYEMEIHQQLSKPSGDFDGESGCDEDESLIQQCIEVIRSEQKASVSLMQRRLRLGYTRAARIMDELENRGIVGPGKGAEPREILIDLDAMQDDPPA